MEVMCYNTLELTNNLLIFVNQVFFTEGRRQMIAMVSCKCPECGADLQNEENHRFAFCNDCGAKILLPKNDAHIIRYMEEGDVWRLIQ
jgi:DNA-directed RNA polymerase subunit RPC12/RpoP